MERCAVVATHHKTGTVWMNTTFRAICEALGIPFALIDLNTAVDPESCVAPMVFADSHSSFRHCRWMLADPRFRIFHLIRDPRDVIISGMHYHRTSKERWLFVPRAEFGGMDYQTKLNSLATDSERYLFEMANCGQKTLRRMLGWNYRRANGFECKYEDLVQDVDMSLFTRIATHLGFCEDELEVCRDVFWRNAMFGGKARRKGRIHHIRSGEKGQWRTVFDRCLGEEFINRFGDALVKLGYEEDNSWVGCLPRNAAALQGVSA